MSLHEALKENTDIMEGVETIIKGINDLKMTMLAAGMQIALVNPDSGKILEIGKVDGQRLVALANAERLYGSLALVNTMINEVMES